MFQSQYNEHSISITLNDVGITLGEIEVTDNSPEPDPDPQPSGGILDSPLSHCFSAYY